VDDLKDKFPHLPERIAGLGELAYNLWWSWHPAARMLFKRLDRLAWKAIGHNPVKLLKVLPRKFLDAAASDPEYLGHYDAVLTEFRREMQPQVCWFRENVTATEWSLAEQLLEQPDDLTRLEKLNKAAQGSVGQKVHRILEGTKPEAVYFTEQNGHRG
jgi:glucan phosphorylase